MPVFASRQSSDAISGTQVVIPKIKLGGPKGPPVFSIIAFSCWLRAISCQLNPVTKFKARSATPIVAVTPQSSRR